MPLQRRMGSSNGVLTLLGVYRHYVVFSLAIALSVIMMMLGQREKTTVARTVTLVPLKIGQYIYSWTANLASLQNENKALRAENAAFSLQAQLYREDHFQNMRLRRALGFRQRTKYRLLPAEVIAKDADRMVNSVLINVGSKDGVQEKMAVITLEGLVGKVFKVFDTTSIVQLLLDRNCRVSALIQNASRDWGIVVWEEGKGCRMENLSMRAKIKEGDLIVSAGMGGVFPKGLKIGTIEAIGGCKGNLFREVKVRPCVSFSHLEEVFVILKDAP